MLWTRWPPWPEWAKFSPYLEQAAWSSPWPSAFSGSFLSAPTWATPSDFSWSHRLRPCCLFSNRNLRAGVWPPTRASCWCTCIPYPECLGPIPGSPPGSSFPLREAAVTAQLLGSLPPPWETWVELPAPSFHPGPAPALRAALVPREVSQCGPVVCGLAQAVMPRHAL